MYIIRNGIKSIGRSKGRNLLIGIIIFVIALSSCIGLSIRQAAENAKESTLEGLAITAQISVNRRSMMEKVSAEDSAQEETQGSFDASSFRDRMQELPSLSIEEMETYAQAESVKDFYYSSTVSVSGTDTFLPVDTSGEEEAQEETETETQMGGMGMPDMKEDRKGFMMGGMGTQGDFTLVGYSKYTAMEAFISGICSIEEGSLFEEGEEDNSCVIQMNWPYIMIFRLEMKLPLQIPMMRKKPIH